MSSSLTVHHPIFAKLLCFPRNHLTIKVLRLLLTIVNPHNYHNYLELTYTSIRVLHSFSRYTARHDIIIPLIPP